MSGQQQQVIDNWQDEVAQPQPKTQHPKQPLPQIPQQPTQIQPPKQPKQTFKQKVQQYQSITLEQFNAKYSENGNEYNKYMKIGGNKIMKLDKDFAELGKQIAQKLCQNISSEDTVNDDSIVTLIQQLIFYLYNGLNWQNLFEINKKIKIIKNQRKIDEKKLKKQKNKKNKQKNEEDQLKPPQKYKYQQVQQDDVFSGVATMTSKEEEDLRKKKMNRKQQNEQPSKQPVHPPADDDDDGFM